MVFLKNTKSRFRDLDNFTFKMTGPSYNKLMKATFLSPLINSHLELKLWELYLLLSKSIVEYKLL